MDISRIAGIYQTVQPVCKTQMSLFDRKKKFDEKKKDGKGSPFESELQESIKSLKEKEERDGGR